MKKYTNKILISIGIIYLLIVFFGVWFVVAVAKEAGINFIHSPYTYSDEEEIYPEDSIYFYDIEDTMPASME